MVASAPALSRVSALTPWPMVTIQHDGPYLGTQRIGGSPILPAPTPVKPESFVVFLRTNVPFPPQVHVNMVFNAASGINDRLKIDLRDSELDAPSAASLVRNLLVKAREYTLAARQGVFVRNVAIVSTKKIDDTWLHETAFQGSGIESVTSREDGDTFLLRADRMDYPIRVDLTRDAGVRDMRARQLWTHIAATALMYPDIQHRIVIQGLETYDPSAEETGLALWDLLAPTVQGSLLATIYRRGGRLLGWLAAPLAAIVGGAIIADGEGAEWGAAGAAAVGALVGGLARRQFVQASALRAVDVPLHLDIATQWPLQEPRRLMLIEGGTQPPRVESRAEDRDLTGAAEGNFLAEWQRDLGYRRALMPTG